MPVMSALVLYSDLDDTSRRCCMAVAILASFHNVMLAFGRLPKIGLYIFMLNKVRPRRPGIYPIYLISI